LRTFVRHSDDHPRTPPVVVGDWYSVENDLVLAPGEPEEPEDPGRTA